MSSPEPRSTVDARNAWSAGDRATLNIDDFGMRKLPLTAAEELLEIIMRRYERGSTLITSNPPIEDCGKLLGDAAAISAMLDRNPPTGQF